jgi:hypothetical protein
MESMTNEPEANTGAVTDQYTPIPEGCLRCGGPIPAGHLGLKVFKHSRELGSICHACTWDGHSDSDSDALLPLDELEGWLHSIG